MFLAIEADLGLLIGGLSPGAAFVFAGLLPVLPAGVAGVAGVCTPGLLNGEELRLASVSISLTGSSLRILS